MTSELIELLNDARFRLENIGSTDETDADLIARMMKHVETLRTRTAPAVPELVRYDFGPHNMVRTTEGYWTHYYQAAAIIAAKNSELTWRNMDSAPMDGTIINALARYEDATAGFPRYIGYNSERGVWLEYSRHEPSVVIPWAWRPRSNWPEEWEMK